MNAKMFIKQASEFSYGHAVAVGQGILSNKGTQVFSYQVAFDRGPIYRIGTIANHHPCPRLLADGHAVGHCIYECVIARADILNIENQIINVFQ